MGKAATYTDIEFIEGLQRRNPAMEEAFYFYCKDYFNKKWKNVFFAQESDKDDIFHEAFRTLWKTIDDEAISIQEGVIVGRNGAPLHCKLTTYLMSIARLKNLEISRSKPQLTYEEEDTLIQSSDAQSYQDILYGNDNESKWRILADSLSHLKETCMKILTLFYLEHKKLDEMLPLLPSINNKDSLKAKKHSCLEKLRKEVNEVYNTLFS